MKNLFNENGKVNATVITANVSVADFIETVRDSDYDYAGDEIASVLADNGFYKEHTAPLLLLLMRVESIFAYFSENDQKAFIEYMIEHFQK